MSCASRIGGHAVRLRPAQLLLGAACVLASFTAARSQSIAKAQASGGHLKSVADMLVVPSSDGVLLYVADDVTGAIFVRQVGNGETEPLSYESFELLVRTGPEFREPSSLAYRLGKLYGCDQKTGSVFEVNLAPGSKPAPRRVPLKGLLGGAEYIAVSDNGLLAVASNKQVQLYSPNLPEPVIIAGDFSDVDRLLFDRRNLIVFDENDAGEVYSFDTQLASGVAAPWPFSLVAGYPKLLPKDTGEQLSKYHVQDLVLYRGVFYAVDKKKLLIFARPQSGGRGEPHVVTVVPPAGAFDHISRMAASESSVFIHDSVRRAIFPLERPVPLLLDFPNATQTAGDEQAAILDLLNKQSLLLRGVVPASRTYDSVSEFVVNEVFARVPATTQGPPPVRASAAAQTQVAWLVCGLNGWQCESPERGNKATEQVFRKGFVKIAAHQEVNVPSAAVGGFKAERTAWLGASVMLSDYLTKRNIVPHLSGPVAPGDIVSIESSGQTPTRVTGKCAIEDPDGVATSDAPFPDVVSIDLDEFAGQFADAGVGRELRRLGVVKVVAYYSGVESQRLRLSPEQKTAACANAVRGVGDYIVDRTLLAHSARYKFLDRNGKLVFVNPRVVASASPQAESDPTRQWSWVQASPVSLGFMALTFSPSEFDKGVGTYYKVLPRSRTVYEQQLTLLVPAGKFLVALQALNDRAESGGAPFYAFSAQDEGGGLEEKSVAAEPDPAGEAIPLQTAIDSRKRLAEMIHFPSDLTSKDFSWTLVGVVENVESIDVTHQCFFDEKYSSWTWGDTPPDISPEAAKKLREPGSVKDEGEFNKKDNPEHGTHVSALIGAKSVLPGLLPTVRLVKIDPQRLRADMEAKIKDVQIFNFSVELPGKATVYTGLVNKIRDGLLGNRDVLLVVAAGNDNKDLGSEAPPPPVSWVADIPDNVIVVGSTTTADPATARRVMSNYSKKFVQLFAPGEKVYSAAKNNLYVAASGTSQAAPLVTAVAAALSAKNIHATWIKAALIYSADWDTSFMDETWGGFLNTERAMTTVSDWPNTVWLSKKGRPEFLTPARNGSFKVVVKSGALINDPWVGKDVLEQIPDDLPIVFDDILRIERMNKGDDDSGLFRVIYLDPKGEMKMLINAEFEAGGVQCVVKKEADQNPAPGDACVRFVTEGKTTGLVGFDKIRDYVRQVPRGVTGRKVVTFLRQNAAGGTE